MFLQQRLKSIPLFRLGWATGGPTTGGQRQGSVGGVRWCLRSALVSRRGLGPEVQLGAVSLDLAVDGERSEGHQHQDEDLLHVHGEDPFTFLWDVENETSRTALGQADESQPTGRSPSTGPPNRA